MKKLFLFVILLILPIASFAEDAPSPKTPPQVIIDLTACKITGSTSLPGALGSVSINNLELKDGQCRFELFSEIEGGYTIKECALSASTEPAVIKESCEKDPNPGDYGTRCDINYSFDVSKCEGGKAGNLLQEMVK